MKEKKTFTAEFRREAVRLSYENFSDYAKAGAAGFGIGSHLYRPGHTSQELHDRAIEVLASITRTQDATESNHG